MAPEKKSNSGTAEVSNYRPHPELVDAVEVAMELGKPLLLTGEPGSGKTGCAKWVAAKYGLPRFHKFVAKTTSVATDLFYTYDALGRFSASQLGQFSEEERLRAANPGAFIEYAALGKAILAAHPTKDVSRFLDKAMPGFSHPGKPERSVVLIDEIDKAPKDFPNDLLDEIDTMRFRVRELGDAETPDLKEVGLRPIIIITSNSERQLPEPFLRRCAYFHIPFPKRRSEAGGQAEIEGDYFLEDIVAAHFEPEMATSRLARDGITYFQQLRDLRQPILVKRPSTAELLDWLSVLSGQRNAKDIGLTEMRDRAASRLSVLLKNQKDQEAGRKLLMNFTVS